MLHNFEMIELELISSLNVFMVDVPSFLPPSFLSPSFLPPSRVEPCVRPTPQLRAMPDPQPTERGQGCTLMDTSWVCNPLSHDGNSLFFLIFRVEQWWGVWESWTIQLVCLQNDDMVLKQPESTAGRKGSGFCTNRWDPPINITMHWFRLLGQGQYNNHSESWFAGNGKWTLSGCHWVFHSIICFWITSYRTYLTSFYLLNKGQLFMWKNTFLDTDPGHCESW